MKVIDMFHAHEGTLFYNQDRIDLGPCNNSIQGLSLSQAESIVETLRLSPDTKDVTAWYVPATIIL